MRTGDTLDLSIDELCYGGDGLAFHEGLAVFVQGALPGDQVKAKVTKVNERFLQAQALNNRHKTSCPYSNECGGCQWLPLDYSQQLFWKKKFVSDALTRIAGIQDLMEFDIVPSPQKAEYRNRVQLRCHIGENGRISLGYFKPQSHDLVAITSCHVADPKINEIIAYLNQVTLKVKGPRKFRLHLQRVSEKNAILAVIEMVLPPRRHPAARDKDGTERALKELKSTLMASHLISWVGTDAERGEKIRFAFDQDRKINYLTSPGIFQQINVLGNHQLRKWVKEQVDAIDAKNILDLFCGSGNLSLQLADKNRSILGIESDHEAIAVAQDNAQQNALSKIAYKAQNAKEALKEILDSEKRFDCVIADPPRAGLKGLESDILRLEARYLVLVSCDPSTLARDIKALSQEYRIEKLSCFDFFPHSYHVETAAVLKKI